MAPPSSNTPKLDKLRQQLRSFGIDPGKLTVAECKERLRTERARLEREKSKRKEAQRQAKRERTGDNEAEREAKRKAQLKHVYDHFAHRYGEDNDDLAAWQLLCRDLELEPGPSITQCKKRIKQVNVNIWQMVSAQESGGKIKKLPTFTHLRAEIRKTGAYPLDEAKGNWSLKIMLKVLSHPTGGVGKTQTGPGTGARSGAPPPGSNDQQPSGRHAAAVDSDGESSNASESDAEGAAVSRGDADSDVDEVASALGAVGLRE